MKPFLAVLMLMPGLNYGFLTPGDTECKVISDTTCSVTFGGNVFLQVIHNASGLRIQFSSQAKEVFTVKRGSLEVHEDAFRDRMEAFMDNGTFKIQNVQWEDAGQYKVEVYNLNGSNLKTVQVTLEVKANPWPPVVFAGAAAGAFLLLLLVSCCICRRMKSKHKTTAQDPANTL